MTPLSPPWAASPATWLGTWPGSARSTWGTPRRQSGRGGALLVGSPGAGAAPPRRWPRPPSSPAARLVDALGRLRPRAPARSPVFLRFERHFSLDTLRDHFVVWAAT